MSRTRFSRAYTLIELMTVLAISAILLGVGVPGFRAIIHQQQISTVAGEVLAAVHLARSEAIKRGARVDLLPVGDGTDWAKGWIVLVDQNRNQKADPGEFILLEHGPVPKEMSIKSAFTDSKTLYVAYNGTGRTRTHANSQSPQLGSWTITLDKHSRRIIINFLGRPRICNPATDGPAC